MTGYKLNFCPYCGKKLGTYNGKRPNFCSSCGQKLNKAVISKKGKVQCTICHDFIILGTENIIKCSFCESRFHYSCVSSWLIEHNSCPMCQNVFLNPTLITNPISKRK
ncbi:MAG: hypothetical protein KGD73_06895 [Candidatus Lokiarchaeota archaeon]|nr:hypothetical protein [Candidatus Lokiarchaeota archaeon]